MLREAGVNTGTGQEHGVLPSLCAVIRGDDGCRATFSLTELDAQAAARSILLVDRGDGMPLDAAEGPLRLIVANDARPARWVRRVVSIRAVNP